jgi:hypothetical protein
MKAVLLFVVLIGVYFLTQWGVMRMTKRTCRAIIKDLDSRGAYGPASALVLPYAKKKGIFHVGARDYRPQALQYLIHREIVHTTDDGRYYLGENAQGATL